MLFRPLFWTSFMLADWLVDNDAMGAERIVLSSASSKTAYGAAFELQRQGRDVVGLTSPRNVAFTESLGCYDTVLPYDAVGELARRRADALRRPGRRRRPHRRACAPTWARRWCTRSSSA